MPLIRVLVVDDFQPWRQFVDSALQKHPDIRIVSEASDGLEAVRKATELQPDLILLDIGLPKLNGIEVARQIRHLAPDAEILFLSENNSEDIADAALNAGARGYVIKSAAGRELLPAIHAVMEGKLFVSARLRFPKVDGRPASAGPDAEKIVTLP
jgi:DNA-binding NarL/FixJ family response regulator